MTAPAFKHLPRGIPPYVSPGHLIEWLSVGTQPSDAYVAVSRAMLDIRYQVPWAELGPFQVVDDVVWLLEGKQT